MTSAPRPEALLARLSTLHPKTIDLTLDRVLRLLTALGRPQAALPPVVHIAGTNGKGSVTALIRAGLEAAGYRVHAYTSPHLVRFNERIRLAGTLIDDETLTAVLAEVERANAGAPITFFESTTAAAFLAFSRVPADVVLLETGLGGRLDATNVLEKPAVTVLTPVDLDHQAYLGPTLADIAAEKAGILKPGVPAVVARQPPAVMAVFEAEAARRHAPLLHEGTDWTWHPVADGFCLGDGRTYPPPALVGAFQCANAAVAMTVLDVLERHTGLAVDDACRRTGLRRVVWPARLQRLACGPLVGLGPPDTAFWLDGGHNPHAARALAGSLSGWADHGPVDLICGMIETKDPAGYLAPLAPFIREAVLVPVEGGQTGAGLPVEDLHAAARAAGLRACRTATSVSAAVASVSAPTVLIAGSLYLAGQVLALNGPLPS